MTNEAKERAIRWLTEEVRTLRLAPTVNGCKPDNWAESLEVMETCLEAVRDHFPDAKKMMPLTIEQLRKMDKPTPVWAEIENKTIEAWDGYWCICHRGHIITPGLVSVYADKMQGVTFYAYPPAHIDMEEWGCPLCNRSRVISFKAWEDEEAYQEGGPFVQGGAIFCPHCGNPRTPEARAELEKRLRG